ncbi:MAG TPA: EcsC family protein [Pirellulales bacterium]|jgi:hypothetical protein|nr:EcsC family protein [Pirellulales bacterium]
MPLPSTSLSAAELQFLDEAASYLEQPSFLIRVADFVGQPAERLLKLLPERAHAMVSQIAQSALERAFGLAVRSLSSRRWPIVGRWQPAAGPRLHVALTAISGGAGGLFGWPGAAVEIPITTTLMMRSIAEIARQSGADLSDPETLMQCLAVFSYGSPRLEAMESAFLSWRVAMSTAVSEAAAYLALHGAGGAAHTAAPVLVRFLNAIAARFQIVISDKLAAEAVPVAGAVSGSLINAAFTDHFNRVAKFHFGILRMERRYGAETVQAAYRQSVERARQRRPTAHPPTLRRPT